MTGGRAWWAAAPPDLQAALRSAELPFAVEPDETTLWLDTAEGHLARAGLALAYADDAAGPRLLRCAPDGTVRAEAVVAEGQAAWPVSALPAVWRADLSAALDGVRAVHPQVVVRARTYTGKGWTVTARWAARPGWPEVPPLSVAVRARKRGKTLQGLLPPGAPPAGAEAARRAVGLDHAGAPPVGVGLLPGDRADGSLRVILRQLADALDRALPGVLAGVDPEALHDYRVAVRRTRSALSLLRAAAACPDRPHFAAGFRQLGLLTGPLRDLDVYLIGFPDYLASLPAAQRDDLVPLRAHLTQAQRLAHQELATALTHDDVRGLLADWRAWVDRPVSVKADGEAGWPIERVGRKRIRRALRATLEEGVRLTDASPDEALHGLRKTCKKLRYLLEFFRGVFGEARSGPPIKALKRLQNVLGTFNDLCVHRTALAGYQGALTAGGAPPAVGRAIEALSAAMASEQGAVRARFAQRFAEFAGAESQATFAALLDE